MKADRFFRWDMPNNSGILRAASIDIVSMLVNRICDSAPEKDRDRIDRDLMEQMQCIANRHVDRAEADMEREVERQAESAEAAKYGRQVEQARARRAAS